MNRHAITSIAKGLSIGDMALKTIAGNAAAPMQVGMHIKHEIRKGLKWSLPKTRSVPAIVI